jgi:hypothetical protein
MQEMIGLRDDHYQQFRTSHLSKLSEVFVSIVVERFAQVLM